MRAGLGSWEQCEAAETSPILPRRAGMALERARRAGMDPVDFFRRSDVYNFFSYLEDAIETGPTGNNLRDLRILICAPQG